MLKYDKREKYFKYAKYVFIAAPALACLFMVLRYGVTMVFMDEWLWVKFGEMAQAGTLRLADLWTPFCGHSEFFPRLVYLAVAFASGFNSKAHLLVSYAIVCAGYAAVIKYMLDHVKDELWRCAGGLVLGLLMFSPVQWFSFVWGFVIVFILVSIVPPISLYFLYRRLAAGKRRYLVFAIILGVVGSFSSAQGLLVWPAALMMLALHYRKAVFRQPVAITWLAAGAATWFLYLFTLYGQGPGEAGAHLALLGHIVKHPLQFLYYMARMAVEPLYAKASLPLSLLCMLAVACIGVLFAVKLITRYNEKSFFPGAVALFGVMTVAMVSFGRITQNAPHASRYTTATLTIYIGAVLYALVNRDMFQNMFHKKEPSEARGNGRALAAKGGRLLKHTAAALLAAIVLVSAIIWPEGLAQYQESKRFYSQVAYWLKNYQSAPDYAWRLIGGSPGQVVQSAELFNELGRAREGIWWQDLREVSELESILAILQGDSWWDVQEVRELASFLEKNGYNVFAGHQTAPKL